MSACVGRIMSSLRNAQSGLYEYVEALDQLARNYNKFNRPFHERGFDFLGCRLRLLPCMNWIQKPAADNTIKVSVLYILSISVHKRVSIRSVFTFDNNRKHQTVFGCHTDKSFIFFINLFINTFCHQLAAYQSHLNAWTIVYQVKIKILTSSTWKFSSSVDVRRRI